MRLDVYLKLSRLIPRRSVAQEFCDKGLIEVNGSPAKSSKEIKSGDEITIRKRNAITSIKVVSVPAGKQLSKADAPGTYEIVSTRSLADADPLA